jgi:NitT/TauT family transport system ATP-binding protein
LLPWLTAEGNLRLALRFARPGDTPRLDPVEALAKVGLADAGTVFPFQLSGGMQQRLALARLLCQGASLWLMDEPFAALDALTRERLSAELFSLWQPLRPTVLWVTHQMHEALRLADRVIVLSERPGRVVLDQVIDLPRPRQEAEPRFQSLLGKLRVALGLAPERQAA